ncbi:Smad nuclear-interacting protein, putative [Pediculus humanus corporis]|uniref:Smad nuclear-interacting protein, putative n=1 Tax=Pediculus humanus subsp. corporis TaxID=121224 RepID=E0W2Z7_PEDHC|nr:Smad nuclear-interacting protein, putative [Pediculus humanus corporis]EEB20003.1 Smad nuclear-interacting protein, putative [Pediculus humanus corporis]
MKREHKYKRRHDFDYDDIGNDKNYSDLSGKNDDASRKRFKHSRREDRRHRDRYNDRKREEEKLRDRTESNESFSDNVDHRTKKHSRHKSDYKKDKEEHEWGGNKSNNKGKYAKTEVQKPNFGLSGKLAEDTNIFNGVVIKYSEPPEARMPKKRWRLYQFKGDDTLPTLYIHRQSAYLLGRDRKVADIPIDHPSCSKQHAALQYRLVQYNRPDGSVGKQIRLYIIDLESANGTFINNNKIEAKKYVELFEKDVIKFGFSSREYVLLHEHSKDEDAEEEEENKEEES